MSRVILLEGYLIELISSSSNSSGPRIQTRPMKNSFCEDEGIYLALSGAKLAENIIEVTSITQHGAS